MPYKAVGAAFEFFERGSEMASGSRRTRERLFTPDEVREQILADESGSEGMSSGEESDLDRQLYVRLSSSLKFHHTHFACASLEERCFRNVGICRFDHTSCDPNLYSS